MAKVITSVLALRHSFEEWDARWLYIQLLLFELGSYCIITWKIQHVPWKNGYISPTPRERLNKSEKALRIENMCTN